MGHCAFAVSSNLISFPLRVLEGRGRKRVIDAHTGCTRIKATVSRHDEDDHHWLLHAATLAASIRYGESFKPSPLFHDPYAGCFISPDDHLEVEYPTSFFSADHYCLATKFIDETLLNAVGGSDGVRQVVLLTDGMDARPYRLRWPSSTLIFDISPTKVFNIASQKLEGVGAKIPRRCMLSHIPSESTYILGALRRKGFDGDKPSIWVIQGLPIETLSRFKDILIVVSSLAVKGSFFLGELPLKLAETHADVKDGVLRWVDSLFMGNGFRVNIISYDQVAQNFRCDYPTGSCRNILFVAQQLRFSDDQMDSWRRELQRAEDDGDEEGFEDM
ncbi:O-methyltransferase 1, chloroplastic [Nymphaea colorata]|nr:O-methyltransferase 1, chloroplastic [Nymphaea colorata]